MSQGNAPSARTERDADATHAPRSLARKQLADALVETEEAAGANTSRVRERRCAATIQDQARAGIDCVLVHIRSGQTPDLRPCRNAVKEIVASSRRSAGALLAVSRIDALDDDVSAHSVSVCVLMVALGRNLGFDDKQCFQAGMAGLLHDAGEAFLPTRLLSSPDDMAASDIELIKKHPALGHKLLRDCGIVDAITLDVCLHHHEKVDGSGYPDALSQQRLAIVARMGAICDTYSALSAVRPYRAALEPAEALKQMAAARGHFDRFILAAFIRTLGAFPVGSLVRLKSGKLAVVVEGRGAKVWSPLVKVFYSIVSNRFIATELLDLSARGQTDRILQVERNDDWSHLV